MLKEKYLLLPTKMGEEILTFAHTEIQKKKKKKKKKKSTTIISYLLKDVDSEKVLVSKKTFSF